MPRFRKKPVVIEARHLKPDLPFAAVLKLAAWCGGESRDSFTDGFSIEIRTLEGVMTAESGDWIIKGVKGEFYPCKPDIFSATYEPVDG